jgi:broad specificity phosphatase PhoE
LGKIQAQMTGVYLRNADVSKIVSSPLRRARETAQYIADALELNVSFDERLQERMDWKGPTSGLALEDFLEERVRRPRIGLMFRGLGPRQFMPVSDFRLFLMNL